MGPHEALQGGPVQPGSGAHLALRPLGGQAVRLRGGFWGERQVLNREVTIPHGLEMLEEWGSLDNLRVAAGRAKKDYRMPLFMDSDVYKVLEAIAWERQRGPAPLLERFFSSTVDLLAGAQEPDGYLNSYVQVVKEGKRFADPAMGHELYCAGHLFQAAVAEARSPVPGHAEANLGTVAGRFAEYLVGAVPPMADFVPGHPEVEMALTELYRQNRDPRLLSLAEELLGRRGRSTLSWGTFGADYFQDDVAVAESRSIRGHAVRALYLLSGMADVYAETGRPELLNACTAQWEDMVGGKTYLTGGVGARHEGESFGEQFELPPDRAYCETCAAIASIMWNWRMCLLTGQARYSELLERTLYNAFLAGWGLDGRSFFYVNPLQVRENTSRQRWYRCACCPPNLMRLVASLGHYIASRSAHGLQLHQFVPGHVETDIGGGRLRARLETAYPLDGTVVVGVEEAPAEELDLAMRVPTWSPGARAWVNGVPHGTEAASDGYLHLRRCWHSGDEVALELDMAPRVVRPDSRVDSLRGCFALERGPLVYCFESAEELGAPGLADLDRVTGVPAQGVVARPSKVAGEPVVEVVVPALGFPDRGQGGWPYGESAQAGQDGRQRLEMAAVPYYTWCNRGPAKMRMWLPELPAPSN